MKKAIKTSLSLGFAATIAMASTSVAPVHAAEFPNKPLLFIVGPGPDTIPRIMAKQFSEIWGQQVNVKKINGAGGVIALQSLANARPDGHTFLYVTGAYTLNEVLRKDMPNPPSKLGAVGKIADVSFVLLVHPSVEANNLKELVAYAKKNPGKLNCGSAGTTSTAGFGCEMLKTFAGIDIVHVPYKGFGPVTVDLLAGRVHMLFGVGGAIRHAKTGKLRAIAITGEHRLAAFPDVETVVEAGLPRLKFAASWSGILVPAGTPADVVASFNKTLNKVLASDSFKATAKKFGFVAKGSTVEEFDKFIKNSVKSWKKIIADTGLTVQ